MIGCPDTAYEVRMYSLRKPYFMILPGTFRGPNSGWSGVPCLHDRSSTPRPGERRAVLERSWVSELWLIIDCVIDFIDQEIQQSEVFHRSVV